MVVLCYTHRLPLSALCRTIDISVCETIDSPAPEDQLPDYGVLRRSAAHYGRYFSTNDHTMFKKLGSRFSPKSSALPVSPEKSGVLSEPEPQEVDRR